MTASHIFFAALASTAAFAAAPALAEDTPRAVEVHYSDLNLASASGADALKFRVARAAKAVCSVDGDKSLKAAAAANACKRLAIAKAAPQIEIALANAGTQMAENSRVTVAAQ